MFAFSTFIYDQLNSWLFSFFEWRIGQDEECTNYHIQCEWMFGWSWLMTICRYSADWVLRRKKDRFSIFVVDFKLLSLSKFAARALDFSRLFNRSKPIFPRKKISSCSVFFCFKICHDAKISPGAFEIRIEKVPLFSAILHQFLQNFQIFLLCINK